MKYTLYKETRHFDHQSIMYYGFLINRESESNTIKGINLYEYKEKGSSDRQKMAKVLWMLRKTGFIATELYGIQKLPPIDYFRQLKKESLKLYAITYDDIDMLSDSDKPFDIYGLSTHSSHHFGHFFYRIYDRQYYLKVLDLLLPLILESSIICKRESFIISGDIRNQY